MKDAIITIVIVAVGYLYFTGHLDQFFSGNSTEDFKVWVQGGHPNDAINVQYVGKKDTTVIKNIIINRGNCEALFQPKDAFGIQYGKTWTSPLWSCSAQEVVQVDVVTEQGTNQYSFGTK